MSVQSQDQSYITLIENNEVDVSISAFIDELEKCVNSLLSGKLGIGHEDTHQHLCTADIITIISEIGVQNQVELTTRNILLNAIINSEKIAAGAGIIVALTFLAQKNLSYTTSLDSLSGLTSITNLKIAQRVLQRIYGIDKKLYHMILKTCELAGHNGKVYINDIPKDASYIELTTGYRFNCQVDISFKHAAKIMSWNRSGVKIFIIDGLIESVSEIHHLLETLSGSKEPGIIFARGYAEEVIATLSSNFKRGVLDVIPVIVPYDLQGMNMLKDLAVVCGSDVTSSLKGELISNIKFDEIPTVEYAAADASHIVIRHTPTQKFVDMHISDLKSRLDEDVVRDKALLLNERIKALTSGCVEISLGPEYSKHVSLSVSRLKSGIRMMAELSRAGSIDLNIAVRDISKSHIASPVFEKLLTSKFSHISAMAGLHGIQFGAQAMETIKTIGAYIIRDH